MNTHALFLAFFLIHTASSRQDECFTSSCGSSQMIQIRFPFRLLESQPPQCGYPGFDLTCDSSRTPILRLGHSSFRVRNIDYANQQIRLNDPNQCLPRLLLTLNLRETGFSAVYPQRYTLFNCSGSSSIRLPDDFHPISCLGDVDRDCVVVVSGSRGESARLSMAACSRMGSISVPVLWPLQEGWVAAPDEDIRLTWYEPRCSECESRGGVCELKHDSDHDVDCRKSNGMSKRYIITLALGIPASLSVIWAACFVLKKGKSNERQSQLAQNSGAQAPSIVATQPTNILGLDKAVIESFPKTVLSESLGMFNTKDSICPICLGEYEPKESVRTFPTCRHSFHSSCIDEWLHRNATCPVCRKYQKESPPVPLEPTRAPEP